MADISKVEINGTSYNIKDATARKMIEELPAGGGGTGGGASSWADLGEGFGEGVLLEETKLTSASTQIDKELGLVVGSVYTVNWNGTDYTPTALDASATVGVYGAIILGMNTNRYPFTILAKPNEGLTITIEGGDTSATVSIVGLGNIIIPIDGKYLPKGTPWIEEGGMVEILPEYTITEENAEADMAGVPALGLVEGNTYVVKLNGTEYTCVAWSYNNPDLGAVVGLGDLYTATSGAAGTSATGEPFVLMELSPEVSAMVGIKVALEPLAEVPFPIVFSIVGSNATIHKIDPRCLPDGLANVFTVSIKPNGDGTFSADKTYSAIVENGLRTDTIVRAIAESDDGYTMMSLVALMETGAVFSGSFRNEGLTLSYTVTVMPDNTVAFSAGMS
jgi:hypothetical protein